MLFSDGVADNATDEELCRILSNSTPLDHASIAHAVLAHCCRNGAPKPDDISVYVGTVFSQ
eukprot:3013907-Pyramimonas_sp.AAC.1